MPMRKLVWLLLLAGLALALTLPLLAQDPPPQAGAEPGAAAGEAEQGSGDGTAAAEAPAAEAPAEEAAGTEASTAELATGLAMDEAPPAPPVILPQPNDVEVVDVNNDSGTNVGVLWYWQGATTERTRFWLLVEADPSLIEQYRLSDAESKRLADAVAALQDGLNKPQDRFADRTIIEECDLAAETEADALNEYQVAFNNRDPQTKDRLLAYYKAKTHNDNVKKMREQLRDRFTKQAGKLAKKKKFFDYLSATIDASEYVPTDCTAVEASGVGKKEASTGRFGHEPPQSDKLYVEISSIKPFNPQVFTGQFSPGMPNDYDEGVGESLLIPFSPGTMYKLQMVVYENPGDGELDFQQVLALTNKQIYDLGGVIPRVNYFDASKLNNFIFAIAFAAIILVAIMLARRNPNLFIRRINGLEAVDEAIGRATEMGKPVLYLTGLDSVSSLSTLAAINILGRVARRIADYESDLIVPCRDPVGMTICQEVVRESYLDAGRPDVYREDNIFFVTEDQFSFTATTCAIMVREQPAANFLMGYYYAESLLLAETGASTGAIQIAGTDALSQLPFFIVTCDYTLIGEELYAASAYLSREPMLLGSLKGQDLGKALIMAVIIVQTLLFLISPNYDWIKTLVEAL
jgi:hypothetical protein